jgi:hypothetical protein
MEFSGEPIGMYHCPYCGVMVVAGMPHPDVQRLKPRHQATDPRINISDNPELWSDDDDFDYPEEWGLLDGIH